MDNDWIPPDDRWWTGNGSDAPDWLPNPDAASYEPIDPARWPLRSCEVCGRAMRSREERVCSSACKAELPTVVARERRRRMREERPDVHEAKKASRRVEHDPIACDWCGEMFTPKRKDARTCSDAHRQALHRWEKGKSKTEPPVTANRVKNIRAGAAATDSRDDGKTG